MDIIHKLTLDTGRQGLQAVLPITLNDSNSHILMISLSSDGKHLPIPEGSSAAFYCRKPDGNEVLLPAVCYSSESACPDTVICRLSVTVAEAAGLANARIMIGNTESTLYSPAFGIKIDENEFMDSDYSSSSEYSELLRLAKDAEAWTTGEVGGVPVPPDAPQYQNNAKYYGTVYFDDIIESAKALSKLPYSSLGDYNNAGAHNAIYRGKNLGRTVTAEQWAAIAAGNFEGLFIGDYWTINGINWRIAAFDYYYNKGDTACTTHHAVIVPDTNLYTHAMNATNSTAGGYANSNMYAEGLEQAKTTVKSAFGANHILNHRQYLTNAAADGKPSGIGWYNSEVEIMTEQNVYGSKILAPTSDGSPVPYVFTIDNSQFPLFAFKPDMISNRQWFWLRDIVTSDSFAYVDYNGVAGRSLASGAGGGVRPSFAIK